jgi:hypothetical protein
MFSRHSPTETEQNHEESQPEEPVTISGTDPDSSRLQLQTVTARINRSTVDITELRALQVPVMNMNFFT